MELIRVPEGSYPLIQGYGDFGFRISGGRLEGAVLVLPDGASALDILTFDEIGTALVARLAALEPVPELVLIGTGDGPHALAGPVRSALAAAHIAVEVMDTGAACRTYNVLAGEGRRVAAILIPVG